MAPQTPVSVTVVLASVAVATWVAGLTVWVR